MRFKNLSDIFLFFLLILQLMTCSYSTFGQTTNNSTTKPHKKKLFGYGSIYTSYGNLFTRNPQLDLSLSFPYSSSAQGNNLQTFSTNKTNIAPKNFTDFETIHLDLSLQNIFFDCGGGWFAHKNSSNVDFRGGFVIYFGAGASFPFDFKKGLTKKEKRLAIQASMNWSANNFNIDIGSINNTGTTINAFGIEAAPTYTYIAHHGRQSYIATGTANSFGFFLDEKFQFIYPKISIATNPLKYKLHCGISVAYCFPISHSETLNFFQENSGVSSSGGGGGQVGLSEKNLKVFINGNKITSAPFNLIGVCLTLSVGYNFSW